MADELIITTNNQRYGGWKEFQITRSLEFAADEFDMTVTERWPGQTTRDIQAGELARVQLGNDLLVTGFIDRFDTEYDDKNHTISVYGRSLLGDLVDCSGKPQQFLNQTFAQIAKTICAPFGIQLMFETQSSAANKPFTSVAISEGQSYWDFLEYLARIRALRLMSTPEGYLRVGGIGTETGEALVLGENVLRASGSRDQRNRFSEYTVFSTGEPDMLSNNDATPVATPQGRATDTAIKRYRPLGIISDVNESPLDGDSHARWQRNVYYGRSEQTQYTVQGFRQSNGKLWVPGLRVPVRDSYQKLQATRIISEVRYICGQGKTTQITVQPLEAFELMELPEPKQQESAV
jgi:prophage tail gpP-like protein